MKKNNALTLLMLIGIICLVNSQTKKKIYNINYLSKIIKIDKKQKNKILTKLKQRDSLVATENKEIDINSDYFNALENILDEKQKSKLYVSLIDYSKIESKITDFHNNNLTSKIRNLDPSLDLELNEIFKRKLASNIRYKYSSQKKIEATEIFKKEIEEIKKKILNRKKTIYKASKIWKDKSNQCNMLKPIQEGPFVRLFYYQLDKDNENSKSKLDLLKRTKIIKTINSSISFCDAQNLIQKLPYLQKENSEIRIAVRSKIEKKISEKLNSNLKNDIPHTINYQANSNLRKDAKKIYEEIKTEINKKKTDIERTNFFKKTNKIKISEEKAKKIWSLMLKRNEDISNYKKRKKSLSSFDLIENTSHKSIQEIKKEFHSKLTEILTLEEFSILTQDKIQQQIIESSEKQLKSIFNSYKLNKTQQETVSKLVHNYYFNTISSKVYYKYNRKKLNQKLGRYRFYFDKEYRKLLESYDIKIENIENKDYNYEW